MAKPHCEQIRMLLARQVRGEPLDNEEFDRVDEHLLECEACQAYAELDSMTHDELRAMARTPVPADAGVGAGSGEEAEVPVSHAAANGPSERLGRVIGRVLRDFSRSPWAPAAAAAAVIVVATGFLAVRFGNLRAEIARLREDVAGVRAERAAEIPLAEFQAAFDAGMDRGMDMVRRSFTRFGEPDPVIALGEFRSVVRIAQGVSFYVLGEYRHAIRSFKEAGSGFSPKHTHYRLLASFGAGTSLKSQAERMARAGNLIEADKLYADSIDTYNEIIRLTGKRPRYRNYFVMASHYKYWSVFERARIEIRNDNPAKARKYLEAAIEGYEDVAEMEPKYGKVYLNLSLAQKELARLLQSAEDPAAVNYKSAAEASLAKAEQTLENQIEEGRDVARAHFSLGLILAHQQKYGEALDHVEEAAIMDAAYAKLAETEGVLAPIFSDHPPKALQEDKAALDQTHRIKRRARESIGEATPNIFFDADLPDTGDSTSAI